MRFTKLAGLAAIAGAIILYGNSGTALGVEKKVIRINHAASDDAVVSEHQLYASLLANHVNNNSSTLEVKIFPNSGLGQSRQVIEAMAMQSTASASIHIGGMAEFASFCEARCGVIGLPFVFRDYDHVQRVLDGPVGAALSGELEKSGFKVIAYLNSWGYRNVVTTKKEINAVDDLKDLRIRTIPTPIFVGALRAMGASATPMNFGDINASLKTGALDGFEHAASTVLAFKFYESAKYIALTQHMIDPTIVAFSLAEWRKLDASEQALILDASKRVTGIVRAIAPVREADSFAQLERLGMIITRPDMREARAKARELQKEMASKLKAQDLLQQILAE
jgi:tripartite ATP-independent transporter DctP family solute receptor